MRAVDRLLFEGAPMRVTDRARLVAAGIVLVVGIASRSDAQVFTLTKDQLVALSAPNPFERFPDGRPKVPDDLIERARGLSAEEIWAVLPRKGFPNQYEDGFELLHPGTKLVGRAFTAQVRPMRPDVEEPSQARAKGAGMERLSNQTV